MPNKCYCSVFDGKLITVGGVRVSYKQGGKPLLNWKIGNALFTHGWRWMNTIVDAPDLGTTQNPRCVMVGNLAKMTWVGWKVSVYSHCTARTFANGPSA